MIEFLRHDYGWFDQTRTVGPRVWPHFDLLFIHSGQIAIQLLNRHEVMLKAPQAVLIHPQTHFAGRSIARASRVSVQHFMLRGRDRLPMPLLSRRGRSAHFEVFESRRCRSAEPDIARAIGLAAAGSSSLLHELRTALLALVLAQLEGSMPQVEPCTMGDFSDLAPWLMENLSRPILVEEMAARVGLSAGHFRMRFHQETGMSPARYLRQLRAREAQRLLRDTMLPIKRIAQLVGYPELPHLHRLFLTQVGSTPAAYRARFTNLC
ncbi:MAG: helix-turn-helix transcriptional regulator [Phycisphaerales bacterium]|nr:helix-turn-helix transcriptional regulator [Phycisphaerales bacterium]